ncbi:unnamed protein product [Allacma fusca]|uniref:Chitin deacetylase n=1 Tax=Allacma fusca TaxID=39272 RepID=A0A8J2PY05_9HEXA|nr:unnamed protein product [Allacma fusca]
MKILLLIFLATSAINLPSEAKVIGRSRNLPHEHCDPAKCLVPNCFCSGIDPPNGLNPSEIPQIVYLTFDGAHTVTTTNLYSTIFNGERKNPNGQNISATFFINHDYNDYSLTHKYWREGHEVALNSITKTTGTYYWQSLNETGWNREIADHRTLVSRFAKIPEADIFGVRAPNLQIGGDSMYSALVNSGFRYDSSRPTWMLRPLLWPYTTDYESIQDCQIEPCPSQSYPGFWVSPLVDLIGSDGQPCAMVDSCLDAPQTAEETFNLLYKNFKDHYNLYRAPYSLNAQTGWFTNPETPWILEGYLRFVDTILALGDTYIVSIGKGIDWIQNPVTLSNIDKLPSWQPEGLKPNGCGFAFTCRYEGATLPPEFSGQSRVMKSCFNCPAKYPWLNNPLGQV